MNHTSVRNARLQPLVDSCAGRVCVALGFAAVFGEGEGGASIRKLSQYRSSLSDRAAADLAAFDADFVRRETSIFRLGKR